MAKAKKKKVFINYSWEYDSQTAAKLYGVLSAHNDFDVWMDKKDLQGGLQWRPAIRKAIRESDFFISVLSAKSVKGRGVRNTEIYEALEVLKEFPPDEVYLIPALVDECKPAFEEMQELNWVRLTPDWKAGISDLLNALGKPNPARATKQAFLVEAPEQEMPYHYRIGMVDLDMGLAGLEALVKQLNGIQQFFLFTCPQMPALKKSTEVHDGRTNFAVHKVPASFIAEHANLDIDLIACITRYPLTFREDGAIRYNYFAGPSAQDERFLFVSADQLYRYCKEAGCAFEEGLVYIMAGQLIAYFTELDYHDETRGCVMDFCKQRDDMATGLRERKLCPACDSALPAGSLKAALEQMLGWKYRQLSSLQQG